jgi:thiamine-phosphate pyrophosphorylase
MTMTSCRKIIGCINTLLSTDKSYILETCREKLIGLYAITDASVSNPKKTIVNVEQALRGGARLIQFRDKSSNQNQRLETCLALRELTREFDAIFIVNDDTELALATKSDGIHLGQDDISLKEARKRLGENTIIGISCYNRFDLAEQATKEGANYIAFGRFFPSRTKPDATAAKITLIQQAKQELDIPVVAIGGITAENGGALIEAGADMLAVVDSLFGQTNIEAAAKSYQPLFR